MKTSAPVNGVNRRSRSRRAAPSANGGNGRAQDPPAVPSTNGANGGRDSQGRFAKGNRGGPGNPFARRVAAFRRAVCAAVTEEDLADVARCLLERAKDGDVAAAKLLFAYALGRPAEAVDPDTLDLHEWQLYRRQPVGAEDFQRLLAGLPVGLACTLFRQILPCVADTYTGQLREALAGAEEEEEARAARKSRGRRRPAAGQGAAPDGQAPSPAVEDCQPAACTPAADGPGAQGRPRGGRRGKKALAPALVKETAKDGIALHADRTVTDAAGQPAKRRRHRAAAAGRGAGEEPHRRIARRPQGRPAPHRRQRRRVEDCRPRR